MNQPELNEIIQIHSKWLRGEVDGKRADLSSADLRSADLRSANLSSADLRSADLRSANLSFANLSFANLSFANLSSANLSFANLSGANLSFANLSGANLSSADLRSANLSFANLSQSCGAVYAQVSFAGHGERGRQLSAVRVGEGIVLFCGCFRGSEKDLREYIAKSDEQYRASRTKALDFVLSCFP